MKAVLLGVVLAAILAGANAYLGLKVGLTVSASIPAAVISMAVLRMLRGATIVENNIVQTAAAKRPLWMIPDAGRARSAWHARLC